MVTAAGRKRAKRDRDDSLERTVNGSCRGRETKRGSRRARDVNLKSSDSTGLPGEGPKAIGEKGEKKRQNIKMRVILLRVNSWIGPNGRHEIFFFYPPLVTCQ